MTSRYSVASQVLPERLRVAIVEAGLMEPVLLDTFASFTPKDIQEVLVDLGYTIGEPEFDSHLRYFTDLAHSAGAPADRAHRSLGGMNDTEFGIRASRFVEGLASSSSLPLSFLSNFSIHPAFSSSSTTARLTSGLLVHTLDLPINIPSPAMLFIL